MKYVFNTPTWFDTIYFTVKYAITSMKWILNPYRCHDCGAIVPGGPSMDVQVGGWGISNLPQNRHFYCKECILKEFNAVSKFNGLFNKSENCDRCKKHKPSQKFYIFGGKINFRLLGNGYWNGHHLCKDCIRDILINGTYHLDIITNDGFGNVFFVNNRGVLFRQGKAVLFKKRRS